MAKCKQARLCSFGLTKSWLRRQFLATAKCKQARLCSFGLTKSWLRRQFLAMAKCKQARLCSFGLTKLFDNLSQICTIEKMSRNFCSFLFQSIVNVCSNKSQLRQTCKSFLRGKEEYSSRCQIRQNIQSLLLNYLLFPSDNRTIQNHSMRMSCI